MQDFCDDLLLCGMFDENLFYSFRQDGHVCYLNIKKLEWEDVSFTDLSDVPLEIVGDYDFYINALDSYEKINRKRFSRNKDNQDFGIKVGKKFIYYFTQRGIVAIDEYDHSFYCHKDHFQYNGLCDSEIKLTCQEIERKDVIQSLMGYFFIVNIKNMDIYKSEEGDYYACSEGRDIVLRISHLTFDMTDMNSKDVDLSAFKKIEYKEFEQDKNYEELEGAIDLPLFTLLQKNTIFLNKERKKLSKKGIELGKDIFFYDNGWGKILLKDENDNEFTLTPSSITPIDKGTIKENSLRIRHFYALDLASFYDKRVTSLKKGRDITAFDLSLYNTDEDVMFGYTEEGDKYLLYYDGTFKYIDPNVKELNDFFASLNNEKAVSRQDGVYKSGVIALQYFISEYINQVNEKCEKEGKEKVSGPNDLKLFFNGKDKKIYITDDKDREFLCFTDHVELQEKGTITEDFYVLDMLSFKALINRFGK